MFGQGLFFHSAAFIILHELGHLEYGHRRKSGPESILQEKEADRFASRWLIEGAATRTGDSQADRINALFGVATALLWITVRNIFLGRGQADTHPEGYERLFQVLDDVIDPSDEEEYLMIWYFVEEMLFTHMYAASFDFDADVFSDDPRATASNLIDLIAKRPSVVV